MCFECEVTNKTVSYLHPICIHFVTKEIPFGIWETFAECLAKSFFETILQYLNFSVLSFAIHHMSKNIKSAILIKKKS